MLEKILVVDDDADLRGTIRLLLAREFDVLEASNGREAVAVARKERPRLILLDVTMPEMSGIEALRAVKAMNPAVTVLVLTSESDVETARSALDLGAAAYVTKPFEMEFLKTEVRRLMSREPEDTTGRPWRRAA